MDDYALVLNAGSSSLKFCVYQRARRRRRGGWRRAARSTGIGTSPRLTVKDETGERDGRRDSSTRRCATAAPRSTSSPAGSASQLRRRARARRRPPGGPRRRRVRRPVRRHAAVLDDLRALIPLAPLHQPHNLAAIEAVIERLPDVPQVACFDTSFHRGQPAVAELVPLPARVRDGGVQRYGFHGLSYEYIASVLPRSRPRSPTGA